MHLWILEKEKKYYGTEDARTGLYLRIDKDIDEEVKNACKSYCKWLREKYCFPVRVTVYIKNTYRIKAEYGELVCATYLKPDAISAKARVRIAVGDYNDIVENEGKLNALDGVLFSISYGLTRYYQWINDIHLTKVGMERQVHTYSNKVLNDYLKSRCYRDDSLV